MARKRFSLCFGRHQTPIPIEHVAGPFVAYGRHTAYKRRVYLFHKADSP